MNLTRLVVLGLLAEGGPRHGHQIRRDTEIAEAQRWGGVGAGSVHRELRRLEGDGLIEAVRRERVGRWPERTVYGITDEGRRELSVLRRQAVTDVDGAPDPLSVVLVFAGADAPAELAGLLARRKEALVAKAARLAEERARGEADGYLLASVSPLQAASFRRAETRVAAELAWHEEHEDYEQLLGLPAESRKANAVAARPAKRAQD
jgi:DNA-binding PadR family transcriptional regulator